MAPQPHRQRGELGQCHNLMKSLSKPMVRVVFNFQNIIVPFRIIGEPIDGDSRINSIKKIWESFCLLKNIFKKNMKKKHLSGLN